jgi:hypothetical protein
MNINKKKLRIGFITKLFLTLTLTLTIDCLLSFRVFFIIDTDTCQIKFQSYSEIENIVTDVEELYQRFDKLNKNYYKKAQVMSQYLTF